ncbi:alpha-2,8-sialyltransferase 8B-like [Branchiostoma lanceolatum]|uniref:alpha-2,8-sialyltransferase 8B-like n=1 Tax=Branchiostoma lanceolatum TaxID=7740 RepID=UPI0034516164
MSPMRACAMRFQAANFGITLLFVGCIVATMQLIGRKPIRLTDASDSLNNRHELTECCDVESSVLTKQNVKVGDVLPNVLNRKMPLKISRDVYRVLPKESPFRNKHFQTCAVVGNSGILRGSRCGASIDGAEAVFRCNLPPLGKQIYRKDAGVKSTFTTAPLSMLKS